MLGNEVTGRTRILTSRGQRLTLKREGQQDSHAKNKLKEAKVELMALSELLRQTSSRGKEACTREVALCSDCTLAAS